MRSYRAPDPYPPKKSFFSSLFSSSVSSPSSSTSLGKIILPAQGREPTVLSAEEIQAAEWRHGVEIRDVNIETHDDAMLETIQVTPENLLDTPESERYYVIKFNGNGGHYQDSLSSYSYDAKKLQTSVVGFNYRGVGRSTKTPESLQNLVTDGIAQVQRLLDLDVDAEHITLDGHSLGGGVATLTAGYSHRHDHRVYLFNDRSLASFSKAAAGILAPNLPGILKTVVETSFAASSYSIISPCGWDADIVEEYNVIPATHKAYMVVEDKSENSVGDGVISHQASLHTGVVNYETDLGEECITGNIVLAQGLFGGHNMQRHQLISKNNAGVTGQDIFESLAMRSRRL